MTTKTNTDRAHFVWQQKDNVWHQVGPVDGMTAHKAQALAEILEAFAPDQLFTVSISKPFTYEV